MFHLYTIYTHHSKSLRSSLSSDSVNLSTQPGGSVVVVSVVMVRGEENGSNPQNKAHIIWS